MKSQKPDDIPQEWWDKTWLGQAEKLKEAWEELVAAFLESAPGRWFVRLAAWDPRRHGHKL